MTVKVEWVRYGRGAIEALRASIAAAKGSEPLAPVTVVVPSNHVGVATRRLLASGAFGPTSGRGTGMVAVSFMTPYRLAELLGASTLAGSGRRPVSTPVIAAAMRTALRAQPGLFTPVADHAATEAALVAAYRELRDVSPAGLDALARCGSRARDVVRLHRETRRQLEPEWYDEQDLMRVAVTRLQQGSGGDLDGLGHLVVHLPQHVTRHVGELLGAAGMARDVTVVAGYSGVERADAEVVDGVRRISGDGALSAPPFSEAVLPVTAESTRIVVASDGDDEVRVAARAVIDAVRAGTSLDRIAVLYASPEPYARLAHEHLQAAGIATNGPAVTPLASRLVGRFLLDLLALPERGVRRQDFFAWLSAAPVVVDGRWAPTGVWERLSREAGVVAGRADWDGRLATRAADDAALAELLAADGDEGSMSRAERLRADAAAARRLRAFVIDLIDDLAEAARAPRAWGEHAAWARRHLAALLGGLDRRDDWPDAERKAAERVEAAIDRLGALDAVEGPVELEVFRRTLALELDGDLGRVGRFGEGVLVGHLGMGVGLDLDLVVVLGMTEGTCPAPVRDDSLLPDRERAATGGELAPRRARLDRQHRELLATLAGSGSMLLGVPLGDLRRNTQRVASRWVLDIASSLAGTTWWSKELLAADVPWVEHARSFEAGIRRLTFPATEQEHRLHSLLVAAPDGPAALEAASDDTVLDGAAALVGARRSKQFTRFDGNLTGLDVRSPMTSSTSATTMQSWAACPYAYFVGTLLGVDEIENPEDRLEIAPVDKGSLVHDVLERFIVAVLESGEIPSPDEPWSAAHRAHMADIGAAVCADYESRGLTGRPIFWERERVRILRDLQRFLDEDQKRRAADRTRPIAAELAFGFARGAAPVAFELADGRQLRFRGKADRVDVGDDGTIHVVDYKTGGMGSYRDLSEEAPDGRGRLLQLPVYGLAARQHLARPDADVKAEYWFVTAKGEFKPKGYVVTDDVLDVVRGTLGHIVAGIEAGVFPSHPTASSTYVFVECPACDPDHLGHVELRRAWDRKRTSPDLAPYADFAEPIDV